MASSQPNAARFDTMCVGVGLGAIAWAHVPSNGRLSWRDSVYEPQVTMLIVFGLAATLAMWRLPSRLQKNGGGAVTTAGLLLAMIAAAHSPDRHFALTSVGALLSLRAIAGWVRVARCRQASVVAAIALVVLSLVAYAAGEAAGWLPPLAAQGAGPGATLGNRNALARCAAMALPGVWWLGSVAPRARARWWILAATLLLAAIIVSRCRVAWVASLAAIATAVALVAIARLRPARRMRMAHASAVVAIAAGAVTTVASGALAWSDDAWFASTAGRMLQLSAGSGAVRVEQARAMIEVIGAKPLLGVGPAPLASIRLSASAGGYNTFASSDVTGFLVAFGLPAMILLTVGIISTLTGGRSVWRSAHIVPQAATIAAVLVCAAGDATLQLPVPAAVAVLATLAWLPRWKPAHHYPSRTRRLVTAAPFALIAASALVSADRTLRALSVAYDVSVPRLLPASFRDTESHSLAELRRRWVLESRLR